MGSTVVTKKLAYRVTELAIALGLPKSTLYDMIRRGDLSAVRSGRILLVFSEDIERWKHSRKTAP